jgi:NitT/TauT family transport system permease protein
MVYWMSIETEDSAQFQPPPTELAADYEFIDQLERHVASSTKGSRRRSRIVSIVAPIISISLFLLGWELGVRFFEVPAYLLPPPSSVLSVFLGRGELLLEHGVVTAIEVLLGFAVGVTIGVLLALALHSSPIVSRAVSPLLVASQAVPKIAIAPVLVVWFGFGLEPKILVVFLMTFFPILISSLVGFSTLPREHILLARSMGMTEWRAFRIIRLPSALPSIFGGLKVSVTLAVVGAIVGEFVGSDSGLGYLLLAANGRLDTPLLFAGVISLTVMGLFLYWCVEVAEQLVIPWHTRRRTPSGE